MIATILFKSLSITKTGSYITVQWMVQLSRGMLVPVFMKLIEPYVCMGFLQVFWYSPQPKKHAIQSIGDCKLPLGVAEYKVCGGLATCDRGVFPSIAQLLLEMGLNKPL